MTSRKEVYLAHEGKTQELVVTQDTWQQIHEHFNIDSKQANSDTIKEIVHYAKMKTGTQLRNLDKTHAQNE